MLAEADRALLKTIAKNSIYNGLTNHTPLAINTEDYPAHLTVKKASFVTLNINNTLRGCIGTLEAYRPLVIDVAQNAYAAAFRDPRFPPLNDSEFTQLQYHISILSPPQAMSVKDENDLYAQLQPGVDGIVLHEGARRSTFLPSVWESLNTAEEFIRHLKIKAGLSANYWSDNLHFERYHVEEF